MVPAKRLLLSALLACAGANAQIVSEDAEWQESAVPPPPAFDSKNLIRLERPPGSLLNFGIDPASLSITPEGVVRYVVVASSPGGAQNVMYEGIRCATAQHRIYARYNTDRGWSLMRDADWQSLSGSPAARHALGLAHAGACNGRAASRSVNEIVRTLKAERPPGYE